MTALAACLAVIAISEAIVAMALWKLGKYLKPGR